MNTLMKLACMAAVASAVVSSLEASPVSLASLVNGGSITIGDKTFADFGFSSAQFHVTDASVEATVDQRGIYRLIFTGPFISHNSTPSDLRLEYSVATTSGLPLIVGIDQSFDLTTGGTGGFVLIGETVRRDSFMGTTVAQSSLAHVAGFPDMDDFQDPVEEPLTGDQLQINPGLAKVYVTKDVFTIGLPGGMVGPSRLVQSFHQLPINVPDGGSTLGLLGLALGAGICVRHATGTKRR